MNRKEAQKRYDLSLLNDPKVKEWEKKKIRQRYGILLDLKEDFFSNDLTKKDYKKLIDFIDSRLTVIRQKRIPYSVPTSILTIYTMWSFSSFFENDGFWDYSDKSILDRPQAKHLLKEREELLISLEVLNLSQVSNQIKDIWQNHHRQDHKLKELQDIFGKPAFRDTMQRLVCNLVKKSRDELQQLADINTNT
jgi:hypothetical protein